MRAFPPAEYVPDVLPHSPVEEKPVEEKPVEENPVEEEPVEEKPERIKIFYGDEIELKDVNNMQNAMIQNNETESENDNP